MTRIAVIYYSATGNVHALARAVADGAAGEGADVRLRHVAELPQEMLISFRQHWGRHRSELEDQPEAALEDIEWADGLAFGTPTRFGNVAAQLKVFLDLAGELWQEGKLIDKVGTAFTSAQTEHGGHESTILALNNTLYHWGAIVLPLGYTVHDVFNGGGNPYGTSFTSDHHVEGPDDTTLVVARAQGARLARVAGAVAAARTAGLPTAKPAAEISSSTGKKSEKIPVHAVGSDADWIVAQKRRLADTSHVFTSEEVFSLAQSLREAKRAHAVALAELHQADADPVEDWAVWYAEYLLEVR